MSRAAEDEWLEMLSWRLWDGMTPQQIANCIDYITEDLTKKGYGSAAPDGYIKLPDGARCECVHTWTDSGGGYWCCDTAGKCDAARDDKGLVNKVRDLIYAEGLTSLERADKIIALVRDPK